jgi:ketosteroid isomerase-like protein
MIRTFALLILFAFGAFAADEVAAVHEASEGWRTAAINQDKAGLEKWLADDLMYAHANGHKQNKAEYIASVTSGPKHYDTFKESDLKISIYGNAAVLSGIEDVTPGKGEAYRVRRLEVYVKHGDHWQMAAHQSARMQSRDAK